MVSHPNEPEAHEELNLDVDPIPDSKDIGEKPAPVESPEDPALGAASDDGCVEDQNMEATDTTVVGVDDLVVDTETEDLHRLVMPGIQEHPAQSFPQPKVPPIPNPYEPDPNPA